MGIYILRRLLQTMLMMFILSIIQFALVNLAPGGPLVGQGQTRHVRPEQAAMLRRQNGLDKPLPVQYIVWLVGNDWMKIDPRRGWDRRYLRDAQRRLARRLWLFLLDAPAGAD